MTMTISVTSREAIKLLRDLEGRGLIQVNAPQEPAAAPRAGAPAATRTGFLQGAIAVPADFDTMGRETIAALFEGER
jgi:hypothetical protein